MTWSVLGLIGLTALTQPSGPASVSWSPDSRWVAYTVATRPDLGSLADVWLTRPDVLFSGPARPAAETTAHESVLYKLFVREARTGATTLIEESAEPLTTPSWRDDGGALAFGRLVASASGRIRLDVVIREGLDRSRILSAIEIDAASGDPARLLLVAPVWSPDGRYLAVPGPRPEQFQVLRGDNGQVMKVVDDGRWPAWSPDGTRLAFVRRGPVDRVRVIEGGFGAERPVAELGQTFQPPVWSRDGKTLAAISRRTIPRGLTSFCLTELVQVRVDTGAVETLARLSTDPLGPNRTGPSTSFALSKEGDELFYTQEGDGQPAALVWFRPRTGETVTRVHPIDINLPLGGLSLSPDGKRLALRFGNGGPGQPLGFWEPSGARLTLAFPDDPSRLEWARLLIGAALDLLRAGMPEAKIGGRAVERATVLPIPGEIPPRQEVLDRLRRLGVIGRPLCDRVGGDPALDGFFLQARLFFDFLKGDFASALTALETLDQRGGSPDERIRLLSLRAQLQVGLGELDKARDVSEYLETVHARSPRTIETTPAGVVWSDGPVRAPGWPAYLSLWVGNLERAAKAKPGADEETLPFRFPRPLVPRDDPPFRLPPGMPR